jgi:pimeloyl-ACP methyl ester carboxylesterase
LYEDALPDKSCPATTTAEAIASGRVNLNALLFKAAGAGPHPTILLLHGLPGNEQNLDLAQSLRRAGWNVLTLHYRGSWGTPGSFSFANCLEDAATAMTWLRQEAAVAGKVDAGQLVVVGHSMGGFIAAHLAASDPDIKAACLISGVDLGSSFGSRQREADAVAAVDDNVGFGEGLHILSGTSAEALAMEAFKYGPAWRLAGYSAKLADRPLLLLTSDDGFAAASKKLGDAVATISRGKLSEVHLPTDHSYSDHRIRLQVEVLNWLVTATNLPNQPDPGAPCSSS